MRGAPCPSFPVDAFKHVCPGGDNPNQRSVIALFKVLLRCQPNTTPKQLQLLIDAMEWVKRVKVDEKYLDECKLVRHHFDLALLHSWATMKKEGLATKTWWALRKNIAGLVMSVDDVQKLVDRKETWSSAEKEVRRTVQGSDAGQRIFGLAFRCVEDERVMASIKASLQTLLKKPITSATVAAGRQSFAKLIASHGSDASSSFNK